VIDFAASKILKTSGVGATIGGPRFHRTASQCPWRVPRCSVAARATCAPCRYRRCFGWPSSLSLVPGMVTACGITGASDTKANKRDARYQSVAKTIILGSCRFPPPWIQRGSQQIPPNPSPDLCNKASRGRSPTCRRQQHGN
jgi:hypothetical protein